MRRKSVSLKRSKKKMQRSGKMSSEKFLLYGWDIIGLELVRGNCVYKYLQTRQNIKYAF